MESVTDRCQSACAAYYVVLHSSVREERFPTEDEIMRLSDCAHEESCLDLDREFVVYLRDCKVVTERDFIDRVRDHTVALVRSSLSKHALIDLEQNLKNYLRVLVNMAYNLNHTKEFRDFFLDCVEKVRRCNQFVSRISRPGQLFSFAPVSRVCSSW